MKRRRTGAEDDVNRKDGNDRRLASAKEKRTSRRESGWCGGCGEDEQRGGVWGDGDEGGKEDERG